MESLLKGRPASTGIAQGRVRVIIDMKNLTLFKKGEILVSKMTNPSMVFAMGKAAAIVTDEGGMTCHAAIISRELGIPCVVGTEKATTSLKDGMIIQINGNNGNIFLIANGNGERN